MRLLGVDYGLSKIGLAIAVDDLINPLTILKNKPNHLLQVEAISYIKNLVLQEKTQKIIIGNPYLRGHFSPNSKHLLAFIMALKTAVGNEIEIVEVDEYKTNDSSQDEMSKVGIKKKDIKNDDAFSAGVILRRYLEESV